jgi:hypothetical protein
MSILQGDPLPSIKTTKDIVTTGPDWYTTYLQDLAKAGSGVVAQTPEQLVAGFSPLQQQAFTQAPTTLTSYKPELQAAQATATQAAQGATPEAIQGFMNPYTSSVVDEMARLSQQSMQQNLLPTLKAGFVGSGALGGQRYASALGQLGADVQANLTGQQTGALQKGYSEALRAALDQAGLMRQTADTQRGLATAEQEAGLRELEQLYKLGSEQQKLEQAKILAPVTAATGAANIFSNLKVPSTVSEEAYGPIPGAYSSSPLQQAVGLGTLFASGQGGTSAASGIMGALKDFGGWIGSLGSGGD